MALSLLGWPAEPLRSSSKESVIKRSAVLFRANRQVIQDLRGCAKNGKTVRLLAGKAPRLQYDSTSIDLSLDIEKFVHEIYVPAHKDSLSYQASVGQHMSIANNSSYMPHNTAGSDDALAKLKQSLHKYSEDKEANQATISSSVLVTNKSNKLLTNRHISNTPRASASPHNKPSKVTTHPTSYPSADAATLEISKKMTFVLSHLLASGPQQDTTICNLTRIPKSKRHALLQKIATHDAKSNKWSLNDKAYKDLDLWKFQYTTEDLRESAVENAIRAYDRLRLSKEDKHWQLLLNEKERGKGKCISRLQTSQLSASQRQPSPYGGSSPFGPASDNENRASGRLTPLPSGTTMSRSTSATGKGMSIGKRLKESQKQTVAKAAKDAREAKKKEKDDRSATSKSTVPKIAKPSTAAVGKANSRFKSDEVIHSSDDDESDIAMKAMSSRQDHNSPRPRQGGEASLKSSSRDESTLKPSVASNCVKTASSRPLSSAGIAAKVDAAPRPVKTRDDTTPVHSSVSDKRRSEVSKQTPSQQTEKTVGSTADVMLQKPLISPRKLHSKPKDPSPLGRSSGSPSLFGNHERISATVKKVTNIPAKDSKAAPRTAGSRSELKRSCSTADEIDRPRKVAPVSGLKTSDSPGTTKRPATLQSKVSTSDLPLKRKANEMSSDVRDRDLDTYSAKHRRTESSSTQSMTFSASSGNSNTTTARTSLASPSPPMNSRPWIRSPFNSSSSQSQDPIKLSWERALDEAERFRKELYPAYLKLRTKIEQSQPGESSRTEQEKLFQMHNRLKDLKKDICFAATYA